MTMKPIKIERATLSLRKKSISNLSVSELSILKGGLATKPSNTTDNGTSAFPVTDYCYPNTVVLTAGTRPYSETC
jgi:hypothetical protein